MHLVAAVYAEHFFASLTCLSLGQADALQNLSATAVRAPPHPDGFRFFVHSCLAGSTT
jgi:hypothetical protein